MMLVWECRDGVGAKTDISRELRNIKQELKVLGEHKQAEAQIIDKGAAASANGMLEIIRYMMNENKKTTMLLKSIADAMGRIESAIVDAAGEQGDGPGAGAEEHTAIHELALSELDTNIVETLQIRGLSCADDIKEAMNYSCRNAASARLNKLYKLGIIERHQLGHKVYYRYNAGKAATTLILSPHSKRA